MSDAAMSASDRHPDAVPTSYLLACGLLRNCAPALPARTRQDLLSEAGNKEDSQSRVRSLARCEWNPSLFESDKHHLDGLRVSHPIGRRIHPAFRGLRTSSNQPRERRGEGSVGGGTNTEPRTYEIIKHRKTSAEDKEERGSRVKGLEEVEIPLPRLEGGVCQGTAFCLTRPPAGGRKGSHYSCTVPHSGGPPEPPR